MRNSREGFTILEIVITLALFTGVLLALMSLKGNLDLLRSLVLQRLQSRSDVDQSLQIMATELRSAGPSSLGSYPIESAATSSLVFYSDIDKDGLFDRVRYFVSTSTLLKGVVKPVGNPLAYATSSEIITKAITNLVSSTAPFFSYYDASYAASSSALSAPIDVSKVRLVKLSFITDANTKTAPGGLSFSLFVDIRNLRSN